MFWTHVPLSSWTLVTMVIGAVVSASAFRSFARWQGWRPVPTLLVLLLLTGTLALTVTPDGDRAPLGLVACIPEGWNDFRYEITHDGGGLGGMVLNVLLFLPLAATVVLATRRVWPAMAVSVLPLAIEAVQIILPGRSCGVTDLLTNIAGVLLGAAVGGVLERRRARYSRTSWNRATAPPFRS